MRALRAAAWEIRRQTGLMEHDDYALVFTAPRFETHEDAILAREGGFEIVRIWGRLPIALSRTTPQLAAGRSAVETIAFARGLRSRGIALAPLVAAMEGPAAPRNQTRILVLGFEPYGGRSSNASAIAARALDGAADVVAVRMLPVEWDRAAQDALAHIDALGPDFVLAFGEHAAGWFHIETLVYNRRWTSQMDNAGHTASTHFFAPQGPAAYDWPGQPYHLASALAEKGYPLRVSRDAGREQCAGVLYALAARQTETPDFHFAFMHVPRVGEPLAEGNGPVRCRPDFLRSFARECLREIRNRRE
jgi:pyrrolidone-carboxylate peptidase